jgi:hypothetical protein
MKGVECVGGGGAAVVVGGGGIVTSVVEGGVQLDEEGLVGVEGEHFGDVGGLSVLK